MKKFWILAAALVAGLSLSSCTPVDEQLPTLRILTFEDADYKAGVNYIGESSWSSLIDDSQYGGPLLYGEYDAATYTYYGSGYGWYDEHNTFIKSEIPSIDWSGNGNATTAYTNGGQAVSNYASTDLTAHSDYLHQLTVYGDAGKGGHNNSANFCIHSGNDTGFEFGDGVSRVIDHLYIRSTNYLYNSYLNGNGFNNPATDSDTFKVVATGYDAQGNVTSTSSFELGKGTTCINEWTKWDLQSLGQVVKVTFAFEGTDMGEFGLNTPTYFAFDDVAVQF